MRALTFKEYLRGYYQTAECLQHDNELWAEMRSLGWYEWHGAGIWTKRNKHYVANQGVPEWFEAGDKTWTHDTRICLQALDR